MMLTSYCVSWELIRPTRAGMKRKNFTCTKWRENIGAVECLNMNLRCNACTAPTAAATALCWRVWAATGTDRNMNVISKLRLFDRALYTRHGSGTFHFNPLYGIRLGPLNSILLLVLHRIVYIIQKKVNFDFIWSGTILYQCSIKG
jgi:hypothetical protein